MTKWVQRNGNSESCTDVFPKTPKNFMHIYANMGDFCLEKSNLKSTQRKKHEIQNFAPITPRVPVANMATAYEPRYIVSQYPKRVVPSVIAGTTRGAAPPWMATVSQLVCGKRRWRGNGRQCSHRKDNAFSVKDEGRCVGWTEATNN